ncbi:MAG: (2Fe-2S) ferredoxin domain-containing protein [Clostridia bacterium]
MITIHVCIGSACHIKGAYNVINAFQTLIERRKVGEKVTVKAAFCLGECVSAVCVKVDEGPVCSVNEKNIEQFFEENIIANI